jgi:hypothetical protein
VIIDQREAMEGYQQHLQDQKGGLQQNENEQEI